MRSRTRSQVTAALVAATAVLLLAIPPASATVVTGEIVNGIIIVEPNPWFDPFVVDLTGDVYPHECDDPESPYPTVDVDVVGTSISGLTEMTTMVIDMRYAEALSETYALEISITGSDNTGAYTGAPSPYTVEHELSLGIDMYETEDCETGELACRLDVELGLVGAYTGTIVPPASGQMDLDGGGRLEASSCQFLLYLALDGAWATVDDLVLWF